MLPQKKILILLILLKVARITLAGPGDTSLATACILNFPSKGTPAFSYDLPSTVPLILIPDLARTIQSIGWTSIRIQQVICTEAQRATFDIELELIAKQHDFLLYHKIEEYSPEDNDSDTVNEDQNLIRITSGRVNRNPCNRKCFSLTPNADGRYVFSTPPDSSKSDSQLIILTCTPVVKSTESAQNQDIIIFPSSEDGNLCCLIDGKTRKPLSDTHHTFWYEPVVFLRSRLIDWLYPESIRPVIKEVSCLTTTSEDDGGWQLDCHRANGAFHISSPEPSVVLIERQTEFDKTATAMLPDFVHLPHQKDILYVEKKSNEGNMNFSSLLSSSCCKKMLDTRFTHTHASNNYNFCFTTVRCPSCQKPFSFGKRALLHDSFEDQNDTNSMDEYQNNLIKAIHAQKLHMAGYRILKKQNPPFLPKLVWSHQDSSRWCVALSLPDRHGKLPSRLHNQARLSPLVKLRIGLSLVKVINYFHSSDMAHLNLRLTNILCSDDGHHIYLTDPGFGYSATYPTITCLPYIDEPHMLAPELFQGGCSDGISVDMWQLGVALYQFFEVIDDSSQDFLDEGGFDPAPFLRHPDGIYFLYLCAELLSWHPADRPCTASILWRDCLPDRPDEHCTTENTSIFRPPSLVPSHMATSSAQKSSTKNKSRRKAGFCSVM